MVTLKMVACVAVSVLAFGASIVYGQGGTLQNTVSGTQPQNAPVAPECLGCLCEASSACNATIGCSVPYPGAYFCGPFLISWAYWADAGKPVIANDNQDAKGAFENCVNDLYCAAETVRLYLGKFATDCNGDGVVNCQDYARLHKLGGYECTGQLRDNDYFTNYQRCAQVVGVN